jgi:hypothetical protein
MRFRPQSAHSLIKEDMGIETQCKSWRDGQTYQTKALLETSEIRLRGGLSIGIPFSEILSMDIHGERLHVQWPGGEIELELGATAAAKWMEKIRNPRSLMDKLGVRPGMRVAVRGTLDRDFLTQLRGVAAALQTPKAGGETEMLFVGIGSASDLEELPELRSLLAPAGAIWTVYPKGRKDLSESMVMRAGRTSGLTDVKVAGFSATHSALKWVIPKADRPKKSAAKA